MRTMKESRKITCLFFLLVLICFFVQMPRTSCAEEKYPTRTIKFLVPSNAGGPTDVVCRKLVDLVGKSLGQEITVENKPGGGGLVGASFIAKSKPDGYTIGVVMSSVFMLLPHFTKMDFDPFTDLTPFVQPYSVVSWLYVANDSPIKTFNNFIEEGRKRQVLVGCVGMLTAEMVLQGLAKQANINVKLVPFGGAAGCVAPLLGGQVDAVVTSGLVEYARAGKMRQIVRFSEVPGRDFKGVPHIKDFGYDLNSPGFIGLYGPKGLPTNIQAKLEEELARGVRDPSIIQTIESVGETPDYRNSKDLFNYTKEANVKIGKIVKELELGLYAKEKK